MAGIIQLLKYRLNRDPARFDTLDAFFDLAAAQWREDLAMGQTETLRLEQGGKEDSALWSRVFFTEMATPHAEKLDALPNHSSPEAKKRLTRIAACWCATIPSHAAIARMTALARIAADGPQKQALAQAAMQREAILNAGFSWTHRTPEKRAQQRLKQDWAKSPPLRNYADAEGIDHVGLGVWVATLDRDTLHVFVSTYSLKNDNLTPLHAAISNPACDKATALSLLAWCNPASMSQNPKAARRPAKTKRQAVALINAVHARLSAGLFGPSTLAPAPEVDELRDWQAQRLQAEQPLRWPLDADVFEDLGFELPDPAYEVSENGLEFRTPFRPDIFAA